MLECTGAFADVVAVTARPATREEVNDAFREETASDRYRGALGSPRIRWSLPT